MNSTFTASPETAIIPPPATYKFALGWQIVLMVSSVLAFFVTLALGYRLINPIAKDTGTMAMLSLFFVAFAAASMWLFAIALSFRITLTPDEIETSSWWTHQRLSRKNIAGVRRPNAENSANFLVVVPAIAELKTIRLPIGFMKTDEAFSAWFSALRNLDAVDIQNSTAAIADNADFGATKEQRLRRLAVAQKVAKALRFVAVVITAWSFIRPQPYWLLIASLAALPALAPILAVLSRGMFRIVPRTKVDASLDLLCSMPALGILLRTRLDINMLSVMSLIGAATIGAVIVTCVLSVAERVDRRAILLLCGFVAGLYFFGVFSEANALLDRSPASIVRSEIIDKHIVRGAAGTRYRITLAPWGALSEPNDAYVQRDLYDIMQPGSPACIMLRNGALGVPWFTVTACR
jgi:hypothetical protein